MYPSVMSSLQDDACVHSCSQLAPADFAAIGRTEVYRVQGTLTTFHAFCGYPRMGIRRDCEQKFTGCNNLAFPWCRGIMSTVKYVCQLGCARRGLMIMTS